MFVFNCALATVAPYTLTTAGTEYGLFSTKPGASKSAGWQSCSLIGRGAALTSITGIAVSLSSYATASTGGTAATVTPTASGPSVVSTTITGQTISSSTRSLLHKLGCGAAGPGGWVEPNEDSIYRIVGGSVASFDLTAQCGTSALMVEATQQIVEW